MIFTRGFAPLVCVALAAPAALADEAILLPIPGVKRPKSDTIEPGEKEPASSTCRKHALPMVVDRVPFGPGEQLSYDIAYFGIRTGKANLRVTERTNVDGVNTFPVQAQVKTDGFLEVLGNLDVRMVSFLDARTLQPARMVNRTVARHAFGSGLTVSREDGAFAPQRIGPAGPVGGEINARLEKTGSETYKGRARLETDADVVDALSVVYYLRSRALVEGKAFCFELYHRRRLWRVEGKVGGLEMARPPFGAHQARRLDASIVRVGGKGDAPPPRKITAFISNDADRLPLLVQSPERVGTIEVRLLSHDRGRQLVPK